jgi:hypothetical protein
LGSCAIRRLKDAAPSPDPTRWRRWRRASHADRSRGQRPRRCARDCGPGPNQTPAGDLSAQGPRYLPCLPNKIRRLPGRIAMGSASTPPVSTATAAAAPGHCARVQPARTRRPAKFALAPPGRTRPRGQCSPLLFGAQTERSGHWDRQRGEESGARRPRNGNRWARQAHVVRG